MKDQDQQHSLLESTSNGTADRPATIRRMLAFCFDAQNTYGQNPDKIFDITASFEFILKDYPLPVIEAAFTKHLRTAKDFPTPACIVEIIEGKKEGKLCGIRYNNLCKQTQDMGWDSMTDDEVVFKKAYEAQQLDYAKQERLPEAIAYERTGHISDNYFKKIDYFSE